MLYRSPHSAESRPVEEIGWRGHGAAVPAHDGELAALQAENARLIALLESHGIQWRPPQPVVLVAREPEPSKLSAAEKVALFRRLFRGRTDVCPIRWEGKTSGKAGYVPACANEWCAGVCEKPRVIGCAESYPQHIALPRGCLWKCCRVHASRVSTCPPMQAFRTCFGISSMTRLERKPSPPRCVVPSGRDARYWC